MATLNKEFAVTFLFRFVLLKCEICVGLLNVIFQMEICLDSCDYLEIEHDMPCEDIRRRNQQNVAKGYCIMNMSYLVRRLFG